MKKTTIVFLQILIVVFGLGVLAFILIEPHFEGRNATATAFEVYFRDPFLAYVYLSSIAFFVALYQAFKALRFVGENKTFSQETLKALRIMKYCGASLIALVLGGEVWIFIANGGKDDIAGGVFMGLLAIALFGVITIIATRSEKRLQNTIGTKFDLPN